MKNLSLLLFIMGTIFSSMSISQAQIFIPSTGVLINVTNHTAFSHVNVSNTHIRYYYNFDVLTGSSYLENIAVNGLNYTMANATVGAKWNASGGYYGAGMTFNGRNESLQSAVQYGVGTAGGSPPFQNGSFNITVSARIRMNPNGTSETLGAGVNSFYDNHGYFSYRLSIVNDTPYFQIGKDGTFLTHVKGITKVNDSQWHHIAGVYNHSNLSIYVDGVLENRTRETLDYYSNTAVLRICIGGDAFNCGGVQTQVFPPPGFFNGSIDDVELRTTWLNDSEIRRLANNWSDRFPEFGLINFTNINFTGNNTINISLQDCQTYRGSIIQVQFNNGTYKNLTNCVFINYGLQGLGNENDSNMSIRLLPGDASNLSANQFYTPTIIGNITLTSFLFIPEQPAGNFTCNLNLVYDSRKVPQLKHQFCRLYNKRLR